jgi:hypothetical protein
MSLWARWLAKNSRRAEDKEFSRTRRLGLSVHGLCRFLENSELAEASMIEDNVCGTKHGHTTTTTVATAQYLEMGNPNSGESEDELIEVNLMVVSRRLSCHLKLVQMCMQNNPARNRV